MDFRPISAKEARNLTNESNYMKKSVYKWIREEAARNGTKVYVPTEVFDNELLKKFVAELREQGYKIENCPDSADDTLIVSW